MTKYRHEHIAWFAPDGGADSVAGYLTPNAAQALCVLLSAQLDHGVAGSLAEIGVFCGKTLLGLAKASREGERVLGVDIFEGAIEEAFKANAVVLDAATGARVRTLKIDSLALRTPDWIDALGGPARFIHIDGGHTRAHVVNDLQLASSFLADRALVVLDDFLHDWYPDLTEGIVDGLKASRSLVPLAVIPRETPIREGGSKLVCATRDGVDFYRDLLVQKYAAQETPMRRFLETDVFSFPA